MAALKNIWKGKNGPLLIAEIGGNHEGDFNYAKKLVRLAINTGVDVVKLQLYTGSGLVNSNLSEDRHKHFKKFELNKNEHIYLAKMCKAANVKYLASVWDLEMLNWIDKYLDFYKIGSGDLTAYPIIKEFTKRKKPIVISTGLSNMNEVLKTVEFLQKQSSFYRKKENLALLQCTSSYPTPDRELNLSVIESLKEKTGLTVGYSDHSIGHLALRVAYISGAQVMEFHFTDTRAGKKFRDHKISLTSKEVKLLIKDLKKTSIILGNKEKKLTVSEIKSKNVKTFRRAIFPKHQIKRGQIIRKNDLVCLRPNVGIDARDFYNIIGKKSKINTKPLQKLNKKFYK